MPSVPLKCNFADDLVQFEEDFNSWTKKSVVRSGPVRLLSQTRPIPRSPDGDKNINNTICDDPSEHIKKYSNLSTSNPTSKLLNLKTKC